MFTDDTKFIKSISSFNDHLLFQQGITSVEAWCQKWKLPLNSAKCNVLRFALVQHQANHEYAIDGALVHSSNSQRDLGIVTRVNLSWSDHYNHICSKAYRSLNLIRRTLPASSSTISLVRSHLCYCSQIWRPCLNKDITNIEPHTKEGH